MKTPIDPLVAEMVELLDDDLREMFEERAAVREYDAGITRAHAEALALLDLVDSESLSGVTVFQVDVDDERHFIVTNSTERARQHAEKAGGEVVTQRSVSRTVDEEFGGLAEIAGVA